MLPFNQKLRVLPYIKHVKLPRERAERVLFVPFPFLISAPMKNARSLHDDNDESSWTYFFLRRNRLFSHRRSNGEQLLGTNVLRGNRLRFKMYFCIVLKWEIMMSLELRILHLVVITKLRFLEEWKCVCVNFI